MTNFKKLGGLVFWLLVCFMVAAVGALASIQAADFYAQLNQPAWAPPAGVFGPVWTTLYTLMGVAAWLVWISGNLAQTRLALGVFIVQLLLNALWSWLFFAWYLGALAFVDVVLLWLAILFTLVTFKRHSVVAAWLLLPYLLWVSFAAVLNYSLWQLNPVLLG